MRVTNAMMNIQLKQNLRNSFSKMNRLQDQLATGSKIQRPGDDPVGLGYLMRYNSELSRNEEYLKNTDTASGWLRQMDSLMQQGMDVLKRVKTLTQQGATGTTPNSAREGIAAEIRQLKEQLVSVGNSSFGGRYMFNGQKTDQIPYTVDNAKNEKTDRGLFQLNVSPGVSVPISITGEEIFGQAGSNQNVFKVLDDIVEHLKTGDQNELLADINRVEERMDAVSYQWSEVGARMNRFELIESRLKDQNINLKQLRSQVDDVDMAEIITDIKMQESVHQAALSTGARIIQPSLIDFLR